MNMTKTYKDILVIDDEPVILDSIVKICSLEGLTADSADDGQKALELLSSSEYSLIISDIMMPVVDGFTLLEKLGGMGIVTPVVMTTGYTTFENAINSLLRGAIDFIPKPFTIDEITSVIKRGTAYSAIVFPRKKEDMGNIIPYVPCPSKYYRMGYSGWVYQASKKSVVTGLTDLFNKSIDTIKKIELIEPGEQVTQANYSIRIETSDELIHQVYSPITGKIISRNEKLFDDLSILEKDPYFEGWIYQIEPVDFESEIKNLIPCSSDRI